MIDEAKFGAKIACAQGRMMDFVKDLGLNRVCIGFSGGKDSRCILDMARDLYPHIITIHNGHTGEDPGDEDGVLCIHPPKAENAPAFHKLVDIKGQIDGTRRDEDDYVMIDGVDIHRSKMTGPFASGGIWGLEVCFPIWDWTEEEVYFYLGERVTA
jgi:3'-phosphoadenosine 5'-phosphosulfate sulfotransferase (PAPS reductase)/FAD synthetase